MAAADRYAKIWRTTAIDKVGREAGRLAAQTASLIERSYQKALLGVATPVEAVI